MIAVREPAAKDLQEDPKETLWGLVRMLADLQSCRTAYFFVLLARTWARCEAELASSRFLAVVKPSTVFPMLEKRRCGLTELRLFLLDDKTYGEHRARAYNASQKGRT